MERRAAELTASRATQAELEQLTWLQQQLEGYHQAQDKQQYFEINQHIHRLIIELAGNETLIQLHHQLMNKVSRGRYLAIGFHHRWDESVAEHRALLDALKAGDGDRAGRIPGRACHAYRRSAGAGAGAKTAQSGLIIPSGPTSHDVLIASSRRFFLPYLFPFPPAGFPAVVVPPVSHRLVVSCEANRACSMIIFFLERASFSLHTRLLIICLVCAIPFTFLWLVV
ncbi:FCD domain-containing protein [Oceanimonas sp. NS1]|nr:FCD domain-containing protein [Oceanimonas sp. NS1]